MFLTSVKIRQIRRTSQNRMRVHLVKPASDSTSISETYTPDFGKNPADTVSVAESFASVRTFVRAFSDAYSLDDTASAEVMIWLQSLD